MMDLSVIFAIIIVVAVILWLRRRKGGLNLPSIGSSRSLSGSSVRSSTRRQLLRMVGGNPSVAARLVESVRDRYPNRSEQWCWEKAIYDIQRDRRS
ncbi:hypothetical protein C7271_11545 [filamentous cyanobacterium CCP5]|nr:hypothetical protein C7271_11545 [filamentous cyanobacterium CCP5]